MDVRGWDGGDQGAGAEGLSSGVEGEFWEGSPHRLSDKH